MKLSTPPVGVTTVETGFDGRLTAGPRTEAGVAVVHTGLISEAVGAAGLPGISGGGAVACAVPVMLTPTVRAVRRDASPRIAPLAIRLSL
ncbi:MAG: hypothetical protein ABSF84_15075 [Acidimicrobiales bacterium]